MKMSRKVYWNRRQHKFALRESGKRVKYRAKIDVECQHCGEIAGTFERNPRGEQPEGWFKYEASRR